jgi:hypothetical protein
VAIRIFVLQNGFKLLRMIYTLQEYIFIFLVEENLPKTAIENNQLIEKFTKMKSILSIDFAALLTMLGSVIALDTKGMRIQHY